MVHIAVAQIVLTVLAVLLAILVLVSRKGRRIICFLSSVISWICYSLVFYVIGVALSADPIRDDKSASLACYVLLYAGLANSIVSSNSIADDAHQIRSASYQQLVQMVFVLVLILVRRSWSMKLSYIPAMLLISLYIVWVAKQRSRLLSASARSCIKEDLLISEHMATKHKDKEAFDPEDLKGMNYIVSDVITRTRYRGLLRMFLEPLVTFGMVLRGTTKISDLLGGNLGYESTPAAMVNLVIRYDDLVTVEDVWKHIHPTRTGGNSLEMRDICMSFALFKLLRRRFRGCYLHESGLVKTREFVLRGLLSESDPLRAFHIIEAELGFLFDFFCLNHLPDLMYAIYICVFMVWTLSLWYIYSFSSYGQNDQGFKGSLVQRLASGVLSLFPFTGFWVLCSLPGSNRLKVNLLVYICQGRKRESSKLSLPRALLRIMLSDLGSYWSNRVLDGILWIMARFPSTGSYWSNRARMYCLFQADSPSFSTSPISNEAKETLLNTLRLNDGILHDGRWSLSKNEAQALSWACHQEFVAENILVWHIATTLCHVGQVMKSTKLSSAVIRENHDVATMFSGYCAYLVGFAPELIADDIYATRLVFDSARAAALKRLEGEGSLTRMHESAAMMDLQSTDFAATTQHDVVFQGKMLAAQLIKFSADTRWKVLSEFWAELILFISPADNAAAHLEKLKTGGELITHIWALLTHAGILERPSVRDKYDTGNQLTVATRTHGETTKAVSSETEMEVVVIEGSSL